LEGPKDLRVGNDFSSRCYGPDLLKKLVLLLG
jgi:hypothetical protein